MIKFSNEYGAYALELNDMTICWDDEPDDSAEQMAESVREAYHRNIRIIAEAVYDEIKDMFDVQDVDEVIAKLGKPVINPDNGEVTYTESSFDDIHVISFEYLDDEFNEIQYVSVDG